MLAESMTVGRYWATCSFPMSFGHPLLASSDSCTRDRSKDRGTFYLRVCITNIRRFTQIPQPPAQPNFIILCAIMPGLVSSFFASSCSFWCFWLSLQGDSRASSPVGAHLWHKTRLLFLFVPGDTRLMAKMFNPCFDCGMIQQNKLVGGFNTEKYESQLGWLFPRYGKIEHVSKPSASKKFDRWKITRDGLANWASRVASLAFSLRWMAAVLKRVPELALRKASGLVWLDQQNVVAYQCSFGPLLIVNGFSWLSVGLLST